jgi:hypothetical protein
MNKHNCNDPVHYIHTLLLTAKSSQLVTFLEFNSDLHDPTISC